MKSLQKLTNNRVLPILTALCGFIFLAAQTWQLSRSQISVLDEGLYLYKGLLFASGKYAPFQDYGPWTNQMPLAFLLPGWVQLVFGAGLATGRFFSFGLALLSAAGIWAIVRRMSGLWPAAIAILLWASNPAAAKIYSTATSQGLTTFLLVWSLFFSLGKERKNLELLVGGALAGAVVMVRINMLPILPLLLLYVWWEQGLRAAIFSGGGILAIMGGVHAVYWPEILKIWAKWLPLPLLKAWAAPKTIPTWNPDNPLGFRVASFFLAFRFHFAALGGALLSLSLVDRGKLRESRTGKQLTFLSLTLLALFLIHVWASLLNDYCVFCFPTYTAFFSAIGIIILCGWVATWRIEEGFVRKLMGLVAFALTFTGITYSAEGSILDMAGEGFYKAFLNLAVPFQNGSQAWQLLANKFSLDKPELIKLAHTWLPVLLVAGTFLFAIFILVILRIKTKESKGMAIVLVAVFLIGCLLTPTSLFSGFYNEYDCTGDIVSSYQKTGEELSAIIPVGSKIYWAGYSPVTLTYLPGIEIYPSQLHGGYSYRISDQDDQLLRYGWWNESLARKWLGEADYILASGNNYDDLAPLMGANQYEAVYQSEPQNCKTNSTLSLFRRK